MALRRPFCVAALVAAVAWASAESSAQILPPAGGEASAPAAAPGGGGITIVPPSGGSVGIGGDLAPPGGGGGGGGGIAPPSGGSISIEPPSGVLSSDRPVTRGPLAPIRGDQPLTASALLGRVKGQPVFVNDVLGPIDDSLRRAAANARSAGEFRTEARKLIESQIYTIIREIFIFAAAENALTEKERPIVEALVNKQAQQLVTEHGGSIPAANRFLKTQGTTYEKKLKEIRRGLIIALYSQKTILPRIVVTYQMVRAAYDRDPKAWQEDATVELYRLQLPLSRWLPRAATTDGTRGAVLPDPTAADVARAEAEALVVARKMAADLRALPVDKRGAEFARLVEDYGAPDPSDPDTVSRGGRRADLKRGTFENRAFEDYIFGQTANTVPEPYLDRKTRPTDSVLYVLMIGEKRETRTITFAEAEPQIQTKLREAQRVELWNEMTAKLVNASEVEALLRTSDVAVEAAVARYATR